jgi:hypothetical protein
LLTDLSLPRSTHVQTPPNRAHALLDDFRDWQEWSPWEGVDPGPVFLEPFKATHVPRFDLVPTDVTWGMTGARSLVMAEAGTCR